MQLAAGATDLAGMLGISKRSLQDLRNQGKLPRPLNLFERKPLWAVDEIKAWLLAGAPTTEEWEKQKNKDTGP